MRPQATSRAEKAASADPPSLLRDPASARRAPTQGSLPTLQPRARTARRRVRAGSGVRCVRGARRGFAVAYRARAMWLARVRAFASADTASVGGSHTARRTDDVARPRRAPAGRLGGEALN